MWKLEVNRTTRKSNTELGFKIHFLVSFKSHNPYTHCAILCGLYPSLGIVRHEHRATAIIYLDFGVLRTPFVEDEFKYICPEASLWNFRGYPTRSYWETILEGTWKLCLGEWSDVRRIWDLGWGPPIICDQLSITLIFCHDLLPGNLDPTI